MTQLPDRIGKYRIISEVARGGMGAVYKAEHPTLGRKVVIKKLTIRGSSAVRERFRREASIMMDFRNEYIVDVFDHFREGPAYYIVQEYVDGMSLSELLYRERYLPERIALLIFRGCCHALKYAHDRGVVHRDIKPGNILISRKGEVKLVDFGVARIEDGSEESLTREGMTLGTPSYMAPEQFRNTRSVDRRADIYSLGVMLYEMVTGKRPYPGSYSPVTIRKIQHGRYVPPRRHNPALSRFADRLIRRSMRVSRARRFQDLKEVLAQLNRKLRSTDVEQERTEIASYLAGKWSPPGYRSVVRRWAPAIGALIVILAGGSILLWGGGGLKAGILHPATYGTVSLVVRVPRASAPLGNAGLPVALSRLAATRESSSSSFSGGVRDMLVSLRLNARMATEETEVFESGRIWLPAGGYRLTVASAGEVVSKDLYVEPAIRKSSDARAVMLTLAVPEPRRVTAVFHVTSASSGGAIAGGATVELETPAGWEPFAGALARSLRSGSSYTFRLSRSGYYPRSYTVALSPLQSILEIDASLVPAAGEVRLSSDRPGLEVTLDGSRLYRSWGPVPREARLPLVGPRPVDLDLAPGSYELAARIDGRIESYRLRILSGERVGIVLLTSGRSDGPRFENTGYTPLALAGNEERMP